VSVSHLESIFRFAHHDFCRLLSWLDFHPYFFSSYSMLKGLPHLQELILYGNAIADIQIPGNSNKLLSNLKTLNLGYKELTFLPDNLSRQCPSLRSLHVENNHLTKIPMHVSANPVVEPDMESCENGIASMRRYWRLRKQRNGATTTKQTTTPFLRPLDDKTTQHPAILFQEKKRIDSIVQNHECIFSERSTSRKQRDK
jgi:hypothetical protein